MARNARGDFKAEKAIGEKGGLIFKDKAAPEGGPDPYLCSAETVSGVTPYLAAHRYFAALKEQFRALVKAYGESR